MHTIWVTGASSGIGRSLVELLSANGYRVYATARTVSTLEDMESKLANVIALSADLSDKEDQQRIAQFFSSNELVLDAVVVNAGTCQYMDNGHCQMDVLESVFKANVFSAAATIEAALPALKRASHGGHIIGVSSMSVYLPFTRAEYYGASKAAFSYYLDSLRVDLQPYGVSVSVAYPGFVKTPLTEKNDFNMPFLISSDKAAEHLLKVIKRKPKSYAFPWVMKAMLTFLAMVPGLWAFIQKSETNQNVNKHIN